MKLLETLTNQQKIDLLNGDVVGIFPSMILSTDAFYDSLYELCLGYYMARSGEKTISMTYDRFKTLIEENETITDTAEDLIGKLVRSKFLDKWNRVYDALITQQYDILQNTDYTEHKKGNNQNKDTYDSNKEKTGNNTDVTTYDTNVEDNGKTGTNETTTRNSNTENDVYGFNSSTSVGDNTSTDTSTETIVGEADKNTSYNLQTKKGTDSKAFEINENEKHTGTDTTDFIIDEDVTKTGRDGAGAELIMKELDLRNTQIFFDIVYADIDSIATLQIYI